MAVAKPKPVARPVHTRSAKDALAWEAARQSRPLVFRGKANPANPGLSTFHEIGYYDDDRKYHVVRRLGAGKVADSDAWWMAQQEARRLRHPVVLVGRGAPVTVAGNPRKGGLGQEYPNQGDTFAPSGSIQPGKILTLFRNTDGATFYAKVTDVLRSNSEEVKGPVNGLQYDQNLLIWARGVRPSKRAAGAGYDVVLEGLRGYSYGEKLAARKVDVEEGNPAGDAEDRKARGYLRTILKSLDLNGQYYDVMCEHPGKSITIRRHDDGDLTAVVRDTHQNLLGPEVVVPGDQIADVYHYALHHGTLEGWAPGSLGYSPADQEALDTMREGGFERNPPYGTPGGVYPPESLPDRYSKHWYSLGWKLGYATGASGSEVDPYQMWSSRYPKQARSVSGRNVEAKEYWLGGFHDGHDEAGRDRRSPNPAVSPKQYRLAQAVLSGTARESTMPVAVAREIVERTPAHLRSAYSRYTANPGTAGVPGLPSWSTLAGGTGAAPGKHGYSYRSGEQTYSITPYTTKHGRHAGYILSAVPGDPPHGTQQLGTFRSPQQAAAKARQFDAGLHKGAANPGSGLGTGLDTVCRIAYLNGYYLAADEYKVGGVVSADIHPKAKSKRELRVIFRSYVAPKLARAAYPMVERGQSLSRSDRDAAWDEFVRGYTEYRKLDSSESRSANPSDTAAALYATFHGRPPKETLEVTEEVHYHGHLAGLGSLVALKIRTPSGGKATITFDEGDNGQGRPVLASNESGTQLYIRGGDQQLDLASLGMTKSEAGRDSVLVGEIEQAEYETEKQFDGNRNIVYFHKLSEESGGPLPVLLYDTMNALLSISGGTYRVESAGIID
jgi:hypothetical protein